MKKKKTLMITGASGFIGNSFIEKYSSKYQIIPIDLLEVSPKDINFKEVDIVLHLAALVHQMKGAPREEYFKVNTDLTQRMAEESKKNGVKHFVFYSTVKVYGYDGDIYNHTLLLNENSPCHPIDDAYGESKWKAEKILKNMEDENFTVSIIRPPMVYGRGVKGNMELLIKLIQKSPILPFYYDKNRRSLVHIENLLHLTSLVIDKKASGIFLPLDEKNLSLKEIFEGIENGLGSKRLNIPMFQPIFWILVKLRPAIMLRLYGSLQFDNAVTKEKTGYSPVLKYEEGMREMLSK